MKVNIRGGGATFDRVIANEHWIYVRMMMGVIYMDSIVIMSNNDVTQTKFIGYNIDGEISSPSISNPFHIVIDDVWMNTGTSLSDAQMDQNTVICADGYTYPLLWGTWTSTVKPDNTRIELDCEAVENSNGIVTAKCVSETTYGESVFNRIPICVSGNSVYIGGDGVINRILFGRNSFSKEGSITQKWDESTRYKVSGHESNLTINDQFTIMNLPESFVSYWVNTIHAEALMGDDHIMLVPPKSP